MKKYFGIIGIVILTLLLTSCHHELPNYQNFWIEQIRNSNKKDSIKEDSLLQIWGKENPSAFIFYKLGMKKGLRLTKEECLHLCKEKIWIGMRENAIIFPFGEPDDIITIISGREYLYQYNKIKKIFRLKRTNLYSS